MFAKLVILAVASFGVCILGQHYSGSQASGQSAGQYPAGINPQSCPNYPICENPAVAVHQQQGQQPTGQYYQQQPQQQYYQPQQQYYQPQQHAQAQYQVQEPQVSSGQYSPNVQTALDRGEYIGDGDYHGEGLAESGAQGFQQSQQANAYYQQQAQQPQAFSIPQQYHQQPSIAHQQQPQLYTQQTYQPHQHQQTQQLVPAGVDASSCPNYPYCK